MPFAFKAGLMALAAIPLVSSNQPTSFAATQSGIAPWQHPEVVRVDCEQGRGTAFRIGPHRLLSVAHVTKLGGCTIGGKPFTVVDSSGDFSVLRVAEASHNYLKIDCGGFIPGRTYEAVGYARGLDTLTTVELEAIGESDGQLSELVGVFTVIPGQSGGVMLDKDTGAAVGTINTYNAESGYSGSVALKDTEVCANA